MMKRASLIVLLGLILFPVLCAQSASEAEFQIAWNFDNGSLGSWTQNAAGEIVLQHAPSSGGIWYFFRVDGLGGKTKTFVFENARKDYYSGDALPAISYDQQNWSFLKTRITTSHPGEQNTVRYSFTHTFASNRAWLAFTPPYPNKRLDDLTKEIDAHPHVSVQSICQTPIKQLSLPLITITDPEIPDKDKKCIFILSREEAMESAASWLCEGIIRFLLSDDTIAAAVKRRCRFMFIPVFDRDGVALGSAVHPVSLEGAAKGKSVYWAETWPETSYSFYEQRQLKYFLQKWKDSGNTIDYAIRLHSSAWSDDHFSREHCAEANYAAQDALFSQLLCQKYLPWFRNSERVLQDTRFSKFVADLFPNVLTGLCQCEHRYNMGFGLPYTLYKSQDDLRTEGELIVHAFAETLGVPSGDPPPFLHAAELYELVGNARKKYHVRCVYRDMMNRPPEYVRIMLGDKTHDLKPVSVENVECDYRVGVLYSGYITSTEAVASHSFVTSNGSRTYSIPHVGHRIGPLLKISVSGKAQ
jgi:murein tripeptide amidase MpaA